MIPPTLALQPDGIWLNGRPQIVLTSSLFYFRIPAPEWRSRMRALRSLGYHAIDVYFPWNYHELEPSLWDFTGQRDARAFLQLAKEEGLLVIARPGPYICSEWDGGALPAYLNTIPELELRTNNPSYMAAVERWYAQILPILAEFQVEHGGPIGLVQLENELDFYECSDRIGMMTALRDMALAYGINVPLIACSGQGDLRGATGDAPGIVPTCNVYFDYRDPSVEPRVRHYDAQVRKKGYPLCIIETNRSHTDLRRLIAGGAKLLGPYLQTGGVDFGFTTGVTNWGDPLAFMTSHYDFGGMISPAGKVRPEGREAILLSKMLDALGASLALSAPLDNPPVAVHGAEGNALALHGGGWLVGISNTGETPLSVRFGNLPTQFPVKTDFRVAPNTCPFVLLEYPLPGLDAKIACATAELAACTQTADEVTLVFAAADFAEVLLAWPGVSLGTCQGWRVEQSTDGGWRFWLDSAVHAEAELRGPDGKRLRIQAAPRAELGDLQQAGIPENQLFPAIQEPASTPGPAAEWQLSLLDSCAPEWFVEARPCQPGKLHLEDNGVLRGFGWYRAALPSSEALQGILLNAASDVLSVYTDGHFVATLAPGGGDVYLPLSADAAREVIVRAEIWGHANFDDHRLPALQLRGKRGLGGLTAIRKAENISSNWFYQHRAQLPAPELSPCFPLISFGSWISRDDPLRGVYARDLVFTEGLDTRVLHFPGIQVTSQVFVDGQPVGVVTPLSPFLDVSAISRPGQAVRVAVAVEQPHRRSTGEIWLYQGQAVQTWELAAWDERELVALAENPSPNAAAVNFPLQLERGALAWLSLDLPLAQDWERGWGLQFAGQGIKVSAWLGSRLVGRIWLPSEMRPRMAGGLDDRAWLPAAWLREAGGKLHLLLESVGDAPTSELGKITWIQDI